MSTGDPVWVRFAWVLPGRQFEAPPPDGYRLRAAGPADGPGMIRAIVAAYASDPAWADMLADIERRQRERVGRLLGSGSAHFIVAEYGEHIVGASGVAISHPMRQNLITGICVDPAHQGRGLGSALLARSLAWLRDAGLPEAVVITDKAANAAALYARFGALRTEGVAYPDPPEARPASASGNSD